MQLNLKAAGAEDRFYFRKWINHRDLNRYQNWVGDTLDTSGTGMTSNDLDGVLRGVQSSFKKEPKKPALWQWVVLNRGRTSVGFVELSTVCTGQDQKMTRPDALMFGVTIDKEY